MQGSERSALSRQPSAASSYFEERREIVMAERTEAPAVWRKSAATLVEVARAAPCMGAVGVVLLRDTHCIRVVHLRVVAHPEPTRLELRFDLCFGETVVITAVCHMVAEFQWLRAPAS